MHTGKAGLAGKEGSEAPGIGKGAGFGERIWGAAAAEIGKVAFSCRSDKESLLSQEERLGTLLSELEDLLSSAFFVRKKSFLSLFPFSLAQNSS